MSHKIRFLQDNKSSVITNFNEWWQVKSSSSSLSKIQCVFSTEKIWLLTKWLYNCYVTCMHSMKCMQGYLTEIFQKMKNDIFSLHILIQ